MALLANEEKTTTTPVTTEPAQTTQQQTTQQTQQTQEQAVQKMTVPAAKTYQAPQSSSYDKAMKTLSAAANQAPSFSSDYDQTISDLYQQISNRQPFQYDAASDPLYNQYKEQYTQQGQQAMRDTMGQAAALTGGYGSSYGQAVGQQQYDAYLQRLNEVLPDLYRTAYDMYSAEGDRMNQQLQLAGQLRESEYGQFRDAVSDKQYADAYAIQEAEARAQYGDFSGYEALYGEEAAHDMALAWAATNPDAAWAAGTITADEYYMLTGAQPRGAPGGGGGGGSGRRSLADIIREQAYSMTAPGSNPSYETAKSAAESHYAVRNK